MHRIGAKRDNVGRSEFLRARLYGSKKRIEKHERKERFRLFANIIRSTRGTKDRLNYWILYNLNRDPFSQNVRSIANVSFAAGLNLFT